MNEYICRYAPIEIMAGFGEDFQLCNPMPDNLNRADQCIHSNVCSFSRALIEDRMDNSSANLLLTACCDSIERTCDLLKEQGQKVFMINLPHRNEHCSKILYKEEILRFIEDYAKYSGKAFDIEKFVHAFDDQGEPNSGPYLSVMGARVNEGLMQFIESESPIPVKNNTCTGMHQLPKPTLKDNDDLDALIGWYADELLSQIPCMRMTDAGGRRGLIEDPNVKGIVYNTVSFCDFYGFEFAKIEQDTEIPIVKVETDYTNQGEGQMKTRLEAFFEKSKPINEKVTSRENSHEKALNRKSHLKEYYVGIDSGSTSTNVVLLDEEKKVVSFTIRPTGVKVTESANSGLEDVLAKARVNRDQVAGIVTTGYGRSRIDFRQKDVTEITCHAMGAYFLDSSIRTIIDIGGQDSKVITLKDDGTVAHFVMNDKCAAGTGRFLEMMAQSLGITLEEMSTYGLEWKEDINISSMCSVFAQSEVVSLIAEDKSLEDIVHGINKSVAAKVIALGKREKMQGNYMMTGGVARNVGVVEAIEEKLEGKLIIPEEPDICGALGAALIASNLSHDF